LVFLEDPSAFSPSPLPPLAALGFSVLEALDLAAALALPLALAFGLGFSTFSGSGSAAAFLDLLISFLNCLSWKGQPQILILLDRPKFKTLLALPLNQSACTELQGISGRCTSVDWKMK